MSPALPASVAALSPEHRLLLTLARTHLTAEDQARTRALLRAPLDWSALHEAATTHGVLPMVYHHLSAHFADDVPAGTLAAMRLTHLALLHHSLRIRGEAISLVAAFETAGVPVLAFKGPVIAALAYRPESLRTFTDLDLFVQKADVPRALAVLREADFEARNPLQPDYGDRWSTYFPWHRPHGNANGYARGQGTAAALNVDLHWGFASRYFLCAWDPQSVWAPAQSVRLGDASVRTFSTEDTLLFLCLHATKDNLDRLRLVCDIAELLRTAPDLDVDRLLTTARSARCERMLGLGVLMAHHLLDAPLLPALHRHVQAQDAEALLQPALRLLFATKHGVSGVMQRARFQLQVRDRWRDAHGTLLFQAELSLRTMLDRSPTRDRTATVSHPETPAVASTR
jgi:hypothetical protein